MYWKLQLWSKNKTIYYKKRIQGCFCIGNAIIKCWTTFPFTQWAMKYGCYCSSNLPSRWFILLSNSLSHAKVNLKCPAPDWVFLLSNLSSREGWYVGTYAHSHKFIDSKLSWFFEQPVSKNNYKLRWFFFLQPCGRKHNKYLKLSISPKRQVKRGKRVTICA